jgi:hypothetical protein
MFYIFFIFSTRFPQGFPQEWGSFPQGLTAKQGFSHSWEIWVVHKYIRSTLWLWLPSAPTGIAETPEASFGENFS